MGRFVCESELVAKFRENFPLEKKRTTVNISRLTCFLVPVLGSKS